VTLQSNKFDKSKEVTKKLANYSAELSYEDLSPEIVEWAKYLCLDFAGVALRVSTTDSDKAVVDAI